MAATSSSRQTEGSSSEVHLGRRKTSTSQAGDEVVDAEDMTTEDIDNVVLGLD